MTVLYLSHFPVLFGCDRNGGGCQTMLFDLLLCQFVSNFLLDNRDHALEGRNVPDDQPIRIWPLRQLAKRTDIMLTQRYG